MKFQLLLLPSDHRKVGAGGTSSLQATDNRALTSTMDDDEPPCAVELQPEPTAAPAAAGSQPDAAKLPVPVTVITGRPDAKQPFNWISTVVCTQVTQSCHRISGIRQDDSCQAHPDAEARIQDSSDPQRVWRGDRYRERLRAGSGGAQRSSACQQQVAYSDASTCRGRCTCHATSTLELMHYPSGMR